MTLFSTQQPFAKSDKLALKECDLNKKHNRTQYEYVKFIYLLLWATLVFFPVLLLLLYAERQQPNHGHLYVAIDTNVCVIIML